MRTAKWPEKGWLMFKEWGALRQVECWSDDVPHGETTDFFRAVKAQAGESVVFSWIEYPSKEVRNAAGEKMRTDPRMKEWGETMKFVDGKRMVYAASRLSWTSPAAKLSPITRL